MTRLYLFSVLLLLSHLYFIPLSRAQENQHSIPPEYGFSQSQPLLFFKGDTLIIQSDSVYLINSSRYNFYRNLHRAITVEETGVCSALIESYENRLQEYIRDYETLLENCKKTESSIGILQQSRHDLSAAEQTLSEAGRSIEKSGVKLEDVENRIKQYRIQSRRQKILIGLAGGGIGVLVGVLAD